MAKSKKGIKANKSYADMKSSPKNGYGENGIEENNKDVVQSPKRSPRKDISNSVEKKVESPRKSFRKCSLAEKDMDTSADIEENVESPMKSSRHISFEDMEDNSDDNIEIPEKSSKIVDHTEKKKSPKKSRSKVNAENYEVEQVMDMKVKMKCKCPVEFRVRWVGYGEKDDSWIKLTDLDSQALINEFLEISGRKPEYEIAIASKLKKVSAGSRFGSERNRERKDYTEVQEYYDELLPSGTRTRKVAQKRSVEYTKPKKQLKISKRRKLSESESESEHEEYEVHKIVAERENNGELQYKVRWIGYNSKHDSWLGKSNLSCSKLIAEFKKSNDVEKSSDEDEELSEWKVDKILKKRLNDDGDVEYLIRWEGYTSNSDTWEPEENVSGLKQLEKFITKEKDVKKEYESEEEELVKKNRLSSRVRRRL